MRCKATLADKERRYERGHVRNHARNLHRGFPHEKLRYQRKSAVQVIPHFFLTYENLLETG
jgi:hypothetical protein